MIIHETKHYIHTTLEKEVNAWLLQYGHVYAVDGLDYFGVGLGFDFAQTREPTVTDDSLLTFFMRGYWYKNGTEPWAEPIKHTQFEVGSLGTQDLMLHVS